MGERARNYKVDAIEVLNCGSSQEANNEAKEFAKSLGLPGTAGSDAHQVSELFSVYNKVEASLDVDSVLKAIKKGSVSAQMNRGSIHF
jgi:predicted metal-dependent phosphoesterase TrpH